VKTETVGGLLSTAIASVKGTAMKRLLRFVVGAVSLILIASPTLFATVADAQPATAPTPVPATSASSKFGLFVGTWRGNGTQLDVHPDTSATMSSGAGDFGSATPIQLTLKFLTTNYGGVGVSATVQIVGSNSSDTFPVGATGTFLLDASNGLMTPTLNGQTWSDVCGSSNTTNSSDWCGASQPTPVPAVGPSISPDGVAPGHELDYLNLFVGQWYAHEQHLEVRPDGTATWDLAVVGDPQDSSSTELQFILTNGGAVNALASVQVVATSSPGGPFLQVGQIGTFILRRADNVIVPTFENGDDLLPLCGTAPTPSIWCGA
jgi:hypothetical protein